jgi:hypothetical protein
MRRSSGGLGGPAARSARLPQHLPGAQAVDARSASFQPGVRVLDTQPRQPKSSMRSVPVVGHAQLDLARTESPSRRPSAR